MSNKREQLVKILNISYLQQKEYLASLTEEEKSAAGVISDWSPKDVMAHVAHWDAETAAELADLDGVDKGEGGGGVDHINAEVWEQYKDVSWSDVEELIDRSGRDLIGNLDLVDEDQLTDPNRYVWTNGRPIWQRVTFGCFYHPMQHVAELYAKRGDVPRANEIQERTAELQLALVESDTWRGNVLYNLGCYYAVTGQRDLALENIGRGIELYPYLKEWAPQDSDLESLRDDPAFRQMIE